MTTTQKNNSKHEPQLADPSELWKRISLFHGPQRYLTPSTNGACTCVQASADALARDEINITGKGAVWAWFVGSPRAFRFGLERSQGWAVRRMNSVLDEEVIASRDRKAKVETALSTPSLNA